MVRRAMIMAAMGLAIVGPVTVVHAATNQGDVSKVIVVTSPIVSCLEPTVGAKVDVSSGIAFELRSDALISSVSIKSGSKARLAGSSPAWSADGHSVIISLTQDWSNYVVSTCPDPGSGPGV